MWFGVNGFVSGCNFINNYAGNNGGGLAWGAVNGALSCSNFTGNNVKVSGGAIYWGGGANNATLSVCNFNSNVAPSSGGAIFSNVDDMDLNNCNFFNNSAVYYGGAIYFVGNKINISNSNFTSNIAGTNGGAFCSNAMANNCILTNCNFSINIAGNRGGAIYWSSANSVLGKCNFIGNTAKNEGGAIYWVGANATSADCNFTYNHAIQGDNVWWYWTVEDFLNKYGQINDYDYVLIQSNGVGTPNSAIILNKKGITISSEGNVTFDAKGGNFHFEVTGDNVLIEKITFRNFNFTSNGGAIQWTGNNGTLQNCNFINNTAYAGGGIYWNGNNGTVSNSNFTNNKGNSNGGGGIFWDKANGNLIGSTFTGNTAGNYGGGVRWIGANGNLIGSTFISNRANNAGGAVDFTGGAINGKITDCSFTNNYAPWGGGIFWNGAKGIIIDSYFKDNNADNGGAIYWNIVGSMVNCNFNNTKWTSSNGIYAGGNLTLNNGKGIVYVFINGILSGSSILVLNNETYYYPPNTNINFINKNDNDRNSILIIKIKSYYMKALVSDNSGTLLERYRAIKDIENDEIFTNINSLNLIDSGEYLNLVVLQFDTTVLLDFPRDMLISDIVHKYKIDFDVSFHSEDVSRTEIAEIIYNDSEATIGDIVDCFMVLKEKIPKIEICNGSALIVDIKEKRIKYTITSAGKLFPSVKPTIEKLQEENIKIFIASGDRKGAIQNLATLLNIPKENAYGTVTTEGKCKIVKKLQNKGFRVLMVGDGLNDILAFKTADISVLTVEQEEEISEKLLDKTDFIIKEFSEIIPIIERDL